MIQTNRVGLVLRLRLNKAFSRKIRPLLIERNPVAFWQGVSLILAIVIIALLVGYPRGAKTSKDPAEASTSQSLNTDLVAA